jgi:hypothetical protein
MTMVEMDEVRYRFGLNIIAPWDAEPLATLDAACADLITAFGGRVPLWLRGLKVRAQIMPQLGLTSYGLVRYNPAKITKWTVIHELGHAWDFFLMTMPSLWLQRATHSSDPYILQRQSSSDPQFWYQVGSPPPPCGSDRNFTRMEDFAECLAAFVYPEVAKQKAEAKSDPAYHYSIYAYTSFYDTPRGKLMQKLIHPKK